MAFAVVSGLGVSGDSTDNQTANVLTTSTANCAVGTLNVVCIGVDNATTATGTTTDVSGVVDSAGNTYTRAYEYCSAPAGAQTGADVSIWYCVLTSSLAIGGTITATFTDASKSDASAVTARNFSIAAGSLVGVEGTPSNSTTTLASLDVTTANIECLRYRAAATESNFSGAITNTSGWTAQSGTRSGSGTSTAEMCIRCEHIISTGTSAASAPTGGPTGDSAVIYVAFKELVRQTVTGVAYDDSSSTFDTAALTTSYDVTGVAVDNTSTFGTAALVGGSDIAGTAFDNDNTFDTATITGGAITIVGAAVNNTSTFGTASLATTSPPFRPMIRSGFYRRHMGW